MQFAQSWTRAAVCAMLAFLTATTIHAQTTVAASLYGAFNEATSGNGTQQSSANAAGGLIELRQIKNPFVGYEATYSYNRANQSYSESPPSVCGLVCAYRVTASVPSNAHEISGAWVASLKIADLTPFALAGGGILFNVPSVGNVTATTCPVEGTTPCSISSTPTSNSTKGVFVYGAGVDWKLLPRLGLRLQYRGNLYKASVLASAFSSTNAFTHTSEPVIGIFFRP